MTDSLERLEKCALCLQDIEGKSFYVDKYPHHEDCQKKVLYYLKTVRGNG